MKFTIRRYFKDFKSSGSIHIIKRRWQLPKMFTTLRERVKKKALDTKIEACRKPAPLKLTNFSKSSVKRKKEGGEDKATIGRGSNFSKKLKEGEKCSKSFADWLRFIKKKKDVEILFKIKSVLKVFISFKNITFTSVYFFLVLQPRLFLHFLV